MHQKETRSMFQSGREITGEELDEIQETVRSFPTLSLSELAQTICEHLGWFTASGGYKTDACLKLLSRLEGKGFLRLPAKRAISPHGILGCLMFQGAAKALKARDEWIGWTRPQRLRNLPWVINNSRFLVLPWVKVKNLGSHILGKALRRIRDDWLKRWGYSPVLVESFVDPQRYEGCSYKAANWHYLGMTTGEGLPRKARRYTTSPKKIFVRPLVKDFRALLCSESLQGRMEP